MLLVACSTSKGPPAPVNEISGRPVITDGVHVVKSGETLYAIAWRYGRDYREIAAINHIYSPYTIYPGQKINLSKNSIVASAPQRTNSPRVLTRGPARQQPSPHPQAASSAKFTNPKYPIYGKWVWPTIRNGLSAKAKISNKNNGIDIHGAFGQPILATAPGEVVYSGNGLRGYGELVIIKHDDRYLSAYAHNYKRLVAEGQRVTQGQKIAEMGQTDAQEVKLHFEIREDGKPVNPLRYLPTG